jgi:endoglucanase
MSYWIDLHRRTIGFILLSLGLLLLSADVFMVAVDASGTYSHTAQPARHVAQTRGGTQLTPIATQVLPTVTATTTPVTGTVTPTVTPTPIPVDQIPTLLTTTWNSYKKDFIQSDGRVIDHGREAASTSEGESYALLRAVWMHDRKTFDLVWRWSRYNLQVRKDSLLGFLWGQHPNKKWFILDKDSASDADEDAAFALLSASKLWHDKTYATAAKQMISDIWSHEVTYVKGRPYLTAGNWAVTWSQPGPALNPSYFAPYEYRVFAKVDPKHPWLKLIDSSYQVLGDCSAAPLDTPHNVNLPPNWCAVLRKTGKVAPLTAQNLSTIYGYDAFRVMWRTALDYEWNHEPRAKAYLQSVVFLPAEWHQKHQLAAQYLHDGTAIQPGEDPTLYGGDIGAFIVAAPTDALHIVQGKLLATYTNQKGVSYWGQRMSYYEQNWVWFGLALYDHRLPNLAG